MKVSKKVICLWKVFQLKIWATFSEAQNWNLKIKSLQECKVFSVHVYKVFYFMVHYKSRLCPHLLIAVFSCWSCLERMLIALAHTGSRLIYFLKGELSRITNYLFVNIWYSTPLLLTSKLLFVIYLWGVEASLTEVKMWEMSSVTLNWMIIFVWFVNGETIRLLLSSAAKEAGRGES